MKKSGLLFMVLFLSCFLPMSFADNKPAQEKNVQPATQQAAQKKDAPAEAKGSDIVLLIDSSGSMRKTDPHDSRKTSAKLFVSLLGSDDRVAVVSFGDSAKLLLPLTKNTKENHDSFVRAINKVSSREFSTDIYDAVKKGYEELKTSTAKKKVLVMLSDGKLTLGSAEKEAVALSNLTALFPELAKSGITLSTIAFSELADAKFLEDLAKACGGFFKLALTENDIHVIFAAMFEKIKSPDSVPFDGDTFTLDKDIKEAIVFVSKKAGTTTTLVEPSGRKDTPKRFGKNIQWFETKLFDLITVTEPDPGKWKVNLSTKEGNKVFVMTNLSLKSSFNNSFVNKNEMVKGEAWLERDGGPISEKDILDQISLSAELAGPDGKTAKLPLQANGPSFSFEFTVPQVGDYAIALLAEGKTFKRTKTIQFKSVEPPPVVQAAQKAPPVPQPKKKTEAPVKIWERAIVQFGIFNGVLIAIAVTIFAARKVVNIIKSRKKNTKKGAPKKK
ncbi:MAG: VWA domain-containing protein [Nitrospirae bacterium]|nr:VWA domain-containing protein [Nitrospirota bacterium]